MTVYLKLRGDHIERAMFDAHGCGYTIACCSVLVELVEGKPLTYCSQLTPTDLLGVLKEVPPHRQFCAALAIQAIHEALESMDGSYGNLTSTSE